MSKKNKRNRKPAANKSKTTVVSVSAPQKASLSGKGSDKLATQPKAKPRTSFVNRRNVIKLLIGVPVVGAAGAAIHRYDVQNRGLYDLSLIGQGKPVVVQIHDPACSLCRRLMRNTRKALDGNEDILFKVANVKSSEGEAFRQKYHGETVSLILFDANGRNRGTISGVQTAEVLKEQFLLL